MAQVPAGAEGAAAGVLVFSFACAAANVLLLRLLWMGNERRSFVFIASSIALLATASSITQQIHDILYYEELKYAELALIKADPDNAQAIGLGGALVPGVDRTMWLIRWGSYVAECGLAYFWSLRLCQSVYGWGDNPRWGRVLTIVTELGKPFSILVAILTIAVLQLEAFQESFFWYNFVLNFFYCGFCVGFLVWFFLMFIEYFQTRRLYRRMNSQQIQDWKRQAGMWPATTSQARSDSLTTSVAASSTPFGALAQQPGGIYDKYLIVRTFLPALALALFEADNILISLQNRTRIEQLARTPPPPDLSAAAARVHFAAFVPGCLASVVLLAAFATTRQYRERAYLLLVPARWRSAARERRFRGAGAGAPRYRAMDSDSGMLSRLKRLSMERRLEIEVTYEFELREESVEPTLRVDKIPSPYLGHELGRGVMLPRKPSMTKARV